MHFTRFNLQVYALQDFLAENSGVQILNLQHIVRISV